MEDLNWVTQKHVSRPIVASIVRNGITEHNEQLAMTMQNIVEIRKRKVTGLSNDFGLHRSGKAFDYGDVKPVIFIDELYGRVVEKAIRALVDLQIEKDVSLDVIFFEPDATGTKAIQAWLCSRMKLVAFATNERKDVRSPHADNTIAECAIKFDAYTLRSGQVTEEGVDVHELANATLAQLNLVSFNPYKKDVQGVKV